LRCAVANRIGNEGEGYKVALSTLDGGAHRIAAQATGIAQGAFEAALSIPRNAWPSASDFAIPSHPIHARGHVHGI